MTASTQIADDSLRLITTLYELTLEANLAATRAQLVFHCINSTIKLFPYSRAVLWSFEYGAPQLEGVSGRADAEAQTPLARSWRKLVKTLANREEAAILADESFAGEAGETWTALAGKTDGLSVLWVPVRTGGKVVAAIWLERWGGERWGEREQKLLSSLAVGYGAAWSRFEPRVPWGALARRWLWRRSAALLALAAVVVVALLPVRLRVVAPCEVVPEEPRVVAAPLKGVIDRVAVKPGDAVAAGDLVFVYDKREVLQEMKIAERKVEELRSTLARAKVQAFEDPKMRAQVAILEYRLAQQRERFDLAKHQADRLEVEADTRGVVLIDAPHEWSGRAVVVGERVLRIVDPAESRLRLWLPEDDNIAFGEDEPVEVLLDADPGRRRRARLDFVAMHAGVSPGGVSSFMAEAEWVAEETDLRIGLTGSAVLYGERVIFAYWLLRKPLKSIRRYLGW